MPTLKVFEKLVDAMLVYISNHIHFAGPLVSGFLALATKGTVKHTHIRTHDTEPETLNKSKYLYSIK
jgi:hypothetical protein